MPGVKLLSNGKYHVMVTAEGSGTSHWNGLAVTRWREDAVLGDGGSFFYLRDEQSGEVWSATASPVRTGQAATARFDAGSATFSSRTHEIDVTTTVAVATSGDVELRRLHITNLSSRSRALSATSFAEMVLAPAATDASHPAFSKMFVETEIDAELAAIVATRRPSGPDDVRSWAFHTAVAEGTGAVSYETDRQRFIGRGRGSDMPAALLDGKPLSGTAGPVLDAVAAIRLPFVLAARRRSPSTAFTGVCGSRAESAALARRCRAPGAGDLDPRTRQ